MNDEINKDSNIKILERIKSKFIMKSIFDNLKENEKLKIIKYNKYIQNKLDINIATYKDYFEKIIIEIFPKISGEENTFINPWKNGEENTFINPWKNEEKYIHIYFNDNKEEVKRTFFNNDETVTKIKIIIDKELKEIRRLFHNCKCIEKINFIHWKRNDFKDMGEMFHVCESLKEINFYSFNTDNVKYMDNMFGYCRSLKN